jgi:hypothetical protein
LNAPAALSGLGLDGMIGDGHAAQRGYRMSLLLSILVEGALSQRAAFDIEY